MLVAIQASSPVGRRQRTMSRAGSFGAAAAARSGARAAKRGRTLGRSGAVLRQAAAAPASAR